jgi:glycosyltransferase involved in cell wall biosynthesis
MLVAEFDPGEIPLLVIAGGRGTLSAETLSRLDHDRTLRTVVHYIESASDEEISWLYRNAALTVFPSLYEGWGLPIRESHDFGRVCLASDHGSLLEAGEGLAVHMNPFDRVTWRNRILDYWRDHALRQQLERRIEQAHRPVTAVDTANALLVALSEREDKEEDERWPINRTDG